MQVTPLPLPLTDLIAHFLMELQTMNRAPSTIRTYATDLHHFVAFYPGPSADLTGTVLTQYLATLVHLAPASRARKQAALASFCAWATRHTYLDRNPMLHVPRVRPDPPRRYGLARDQVEAILAGIPKAQERDQLLFRLLLETGVRISEALSLQVEDLDLRRDDEHLRVRGKGGQTRTILLMIRASLPASGPTSGIRAIAMGICSVRRKMVMASRCATKVSRSGGPAIVKRRGSRVRYTKSGIPTRPS
jgi:integrase/recombinase XerC/integrase/recombinase XerD